MTNDETKRTVLAEMGALVGAMTSKLRVLKALDADSTTSGHMDLLDQVQTLDDKLVGFDAALVRARKVVPTK